MGGVPSPRGQAHIEGLFEGASLFRSYEIAAQGDRGAAAPDVLQRAGRAQCVYRATTPANQRAASVYRA